MSYAKLSLSAEERARLTAQGLIGARADEQKPVARRVKTQEICNKFSCWRVRAEGYAHCELHKKRNLDSSRRQTHRKRSRIAAGIMNFTQSRVNASPIFLSLAISQTALMHPKKLANFRKSFAAQS